MLRRERGRVIGRRRTEVGPEAEDAHPHRNKEDRDRRQVSLQAAGRADVYRTRFLGHTFKLGRLA